ncbi:MAG: 50S ribosomal protein L24 [Candidatus Nomurabacteria bacterium GW2011_GWB1_37_5]|uniref:Large ribosomal subunit protein uL24 n=1 Tax=Candidatus Nomurabacteria bacterium GW2011_GWB1_37_5 TaxID=1618742 RepID=A0A0G0GWA1_9BACT|nr:MAG: 50S ribosomal protein L24 [Candidatus Nomurabacteria bacterium GW2011_GWB1_37_5]
MNIKKGDNVIVITGKDKGKTGKVVRVWPNKGRLSVEGLNLKKKMQKPRKSGEKGQVIEIPHSLNCSNVMLVDSKKGKRTRFGSKMIGEKKIRISKKSGIEI